MADRPTITPLQTITRRRPTTTRRLTMATLQAAGARTAARRGALRARGRLRRAMGHRTTMLAPPMARPPQTAKVAPPRGLAMALHRLAMAAAAAAAATAAAMTQEARAGQETQMAQVARPRRRLEAALTHAPQLNKLCAPFVGTLDVALSSECSSPRRHHLPNPHFTLT